MFKYLSDLSKGVLSFTESKAIARECDHLFNGIDCSFSVDSLFLLAGVDSSRGDPLSENYIVEGPVHGFAHNVREDSV